jgi:hypothetical protein
MNSSNIKMKRRTNYKQVKFRTGNLNVSLFD